MLERVGIFRTLLHLVVNFEYLNNYLSKKNQTNMHRNVDKSYVKKIYGTLNII